MQDSRALGQLVSQLSIEFQGDAIRLNGVDITLEARSEAAGERASQVAAIPAVRSALLDLQRSFRRAPGLVADGRDMGSVVFPDAVLKVFLTASVEIRAERRFKQLMEKGLCVNLDEIRQAISERDARDVQRAVAPLHMCADAVMLDTTALTIDQAVERVVQTFRQLS